MDNTIPTPKLNLQTRSAEVPIDATPASTGANPAQNYAKGLMDELFGDLDGLLDGTLVPPSEPLKVEEPKPKPPINLDFATFLSTPPSQLSSVAASLSSGPMPELLSIPQDEPREISPSMAEVARDEARKSSYGLFVGGGGDPDYVGEPRGDRSSVDGIESRTCGFDRIGSGESE
jgi:hypothetical protein